MRGAQLSAARFLADTLTDWSEWHDTLTQDHIAKVWQTKESKLASQTPLRVCRTVEDAVLAVKGAAGKTSDTAVLVCGSMHIVGGVMAVAKLPVRFEQ